MKLFTLRKQKENMKYAVYVRKSTEDDEKQVLSISAQKDQIEERFGDLDIEGVYEETKSAFEPYKRPVFNEMMEKIRAGQIQGIISWHPDRLSRNEVDASAITWELRRGAIKDLKFASFGFDNSPEGLMMLQMTLSQSQYFSAKLSKDVKRGNARKRKLGGLTGPAPDGYTNNRADKTVEVDPERFPLIRRAFDLFLTGDYSVPQILEIMNDEWSYTTPKKHKTGGMPVSRSKLYYIFKNVLYAGLIPDLDHPGNFHKAAYPPLITPEEYDRVQDLLGRKGKPIRVSRRSFDLRGFIRCGICDCMITAEQHKKTLKNGTTRTYNYYHCTGKRAGCYQRNRFIREEDLYQQIDDLLYMYELSPELEAWAKEALHEMSEKESDDRRHIQSMQTKAIENTQNQIDKLLDLATRDLITEDEFVSKSTELKNLLKSLQEQQSDTAYHTKTWYEFIIDTFSKLTDASEKFAMGTIVDRKEIMLAIGQNPVLIDGNLQVTPNEWLKPVGESVSVLRAALEKVRTDPQQIQKDSEESIRLKWYTILDTVRTFVAENV